MKWKLENDDVVFKQALLLFFDVNLESWALCVKVDEGNIAPSFFAVCDNTQLVCEWR